MSERTENLSDDDKTVATDRKEKKLLSEISSTGSDELCSLDNQLSNLEIYDLCPDVEDGLLSSNAMSKSQSIDPNTQETAQSEISTTNDNRIMELARKIQDADPNFVVVADTINNYPTVNATQASLTSNAAPCSQRTTQELLADLINQLILPPNGNDNDSVKVMLMYVTQDEDFAKALKDKLRCLCSLRCGILDDIEAVLNIQSCEGLQSVVDWADVSVIVVSNNWIENKEGLINDLTRTARNALYHFEILRDRYKAKGCLNCDIITVVRDGTDTRRREKFLEIKSAIEISNNLENDEVTKLGESVKSFVRCTRIWKNLQMNETQRTTSNMQNS